MKEMEAMVLDSFNALSKSGVIKETIDKQVKVVVDSVIETTLSSYSTFGKQLKETVEHSLKIDVNELDLASYNAFILNVIKAKLDACLYQQGKRQIQEGLEKLLQPAPKEIKLSKLITDFIEYSAEDVQLEHYEHITFHCDQTRLNATWIAFDCEPNKSEYACEYRIAINRNGNIFSLQINNENYKNKLFVGDLYNFEKDLFQLYTAKTKFILDIDDVDTGYPFADD